MVMEPVCCHLGDEFCLNFIKLCLIVKRFPKTNISYLLSIFSRQALGDEYGNDLNLYFH